MTSAWPAQAFRLSLLGIVATLPLATAPVSIGPIQIALTELAILVALVLAAAHLALSPDARAESLQLAIPRRYVAPASLFLLAGLLSLLVTEYPRLSLRELRTLIVEPVALLLLIGLAGASLAWARRAVGVLLVVISAIAALALTQYLMGQASVEAEGVRRALGVYPSANHLALILGRALPFAAALGWLGPTPRWPYRIAAGLLAITAVATFSIAGWLGSVAAVLMVILLGAGVRRAALALGGIIALAVAALPLLQIDRVLSHLDLSQGTSFIRLQLWSASLAMVRDHPILGIGLDNFLYRYQQEYLPALATMEPNLSHPHNWVLHFWLSLGLAGLVAAVWLLIRFALQTRRVLTAQPHRLAAALAIGAAGSIADFLVHGSLDNSYFLPDLAGLFWLTLAIPCIAASAAPVDGAPARVVVSPPEPQPRSAP